MEKNINSLIETIVSAVGNLTPTHDSSGVARHPMVQQYSLAGMRNRGKMTGSLEVTLTNDMRIHVYQGDGGSYSTITVYDKSWNQHPAFQKTYEGIIDRDALKITLLQVIEG